MKTSKQVNWDMVNYTCTPGIEGGCDFEIMLSLLLLQHCRNCGAITDYLQRRCAKSPCKSSQNKHMR